VDARLVGGLAHESGREAPHQVGNGVAHDAGRAPAAGLIDSNQEFAVAIINDAKLAMRLLRNAWNSRQARRKVDALVKTMPWPASDRCEVAVYFSDARVNLYQLRQWYAPLVELSKTRPVIVIARSPRTMLHLVEECPLPVVYLRKIQELELFVEERDIKLMLYVNQNTKNFQMFRFRRMWHVFINHGESDKAYMTSNQFKAYDYAFVAGRAAQERLAARLWDYDVERRAIPIGRPQVDHFDGALPYTPDDRTVVLYSPTWEGDRQSMRYGSIASHGPAMVDALLSTGRHRLIYRPHPRSGVNDRDYRAANQAIADAISRANAADPDAQHIHDTGGELGWQLTAADVAITDVSAMVYDRLATGKPLIVTRPAASTAEVDERGYLGAAEWLTAGEAPDVIALVDRVLTDRAARERLQFWVERHFGDTAPGASSRRFHEAVELLIGRWHEHAALHSGDERGHDTDPFDDEDEDEAPGEP
jgi:hypothetical protein